MGDSTKNAQKNKSFMGIREIAKIANVSTATVSRVINHPELCTEKTRLKVEKVIKDYNYIPNETIKQIFSKSSNTIAIFIMDINNPFYTHLIKELNNVCFQMHYTLLICYTENDIEREKAYLDVCLAKRCEGIILTEGVSHNLFDNIDIAVATLDRQENKNFSYVTSENYNIIRQATNYLYNLGHRKIAFASPNLSLNSVGIRFKGYIDELREKQLEIVPEYIFEKGKTLDAKLGRDALQYFLSLPSMPTAILCANDMIALGVINEATIMNISIPESLSVCGFDHVLDDYLFTPLTTIEQNIPQLALELFRIVTNPSKEQVQKVIESKFIPGQTCAKAPTQV